MMRWLSSLRLAVFAAVTVVLTVWIGQNITGGDPGPQYQLTATFDDVAGMYDGDDVRLAGITVGQVDSIQVVQGRAEVTFSVDDDVRLSEDSTVKVRWRNLIGQRFLGLEPGESAQMLADGDVMDDAENVVDLGRLVNQLVPLAQSVSPQSVNEILTTLLEAFEGNDANFDALVADLDTVLAQLADREATIDRLLVDYETISAAVASRDEQITQMIDNLVALSETFAQHDGLLDDALGELARLSSGLDGILDDNAEQLGATIDHLATIIDVGADNVDTLETALADLPALFEDALPAVNRGEYLRVSLLCLTVGPGECQLPVTVGDGEGPGNDEPLVFDPGGILENLLGILEGGG